jgi:hypothetical protein
MARYTCIVRWIPRGRVRRVLASEKALGSIDFSESKGFWESTFAIEGSQATVERLGNMLEEWVGAVHV